MKLASFIVCTALTAACQGPITVPDGTAVHVQLKQELSSQIARNGDTVEFTVAEPVVVNGSEVITAGATATARILGSRRAGHFNSAGQLAWVMESVTAVDGTPVALRFVKELPMGGKGAKKVSKGETAVLIAGASPVIFYYSPLLVASIPFIAAKKGKPEVIAAGEHYLVFVNGVVQISAHTPSDP